MTMFTSVLLRLFTLTIVIAAANGISTDDYLRQRQKFMQDEQSRFLGSNLILNEKEQEANRIIMDAKASEFDTGVSALTFPPMRHFFHAKQDIDNSKVFGIIRNMPKGAALHMHDIAIGSIEYLVKNVTYRDNLYACTDASGFLQFRFTENPDTICNWTLVSDMRASSTNPLKIDDWFTSEMSLVVPNPEETYPDINSVWSKFERGLGTALGLITYEPVFREYFYLALEDFRKDNVFYIELRGNLPPVYGLDGTVHGPAEVTAIYKEVTDKFKADNPDFWGARFIFAPLRRVTGGVDEIRQLVQLGIQLREKFPDFVAGFDLVGQEDLGPPLIDFIDPLLEAAETLPYFFHAGETAWEGLAVDENLLDAILLNTTRIGHAYGVTKHPEVLRIVKEKDIAIELNPISNQVLELVKDLRNHPAASLIADETPLVISCDDPAVWGAVGLSYDFYEVFMGLAGKRADLRLLKQLIINSLRYSAMPIDERVKAESLWTMKWDEFIDAVLQNSGNFKDTKNTAAKRKRRDKEDINENSTLPKSYNKQSKIYSKLQRRNIH